MKVYVVLQITNYSSNEFCGVFRTWDKAHLKIKDIIYEYGIKQDKLYIQEKYLEG